MLFLSVLFCFVNSKSSEIPELAELTDLAELRELTEISIVSHVIYENNMSSAGRALIHPLSYVMSDLKLNVEEKKERNLNLNPWFEITTLNTYIFFSTFTQPATY